MTSLDDVPQDYAGTVQADADRLAASLQTSPHIADALDHAIGDNHIPGAMRWTPNADEISEEWRQRVMAAGDTGATR